MALIYANLTMITLHVLFEQVQFHLYQKDQSENQT